MNIKEMKNKIYNLLDFAEFDDESAVISAIESTARNVALLTKCIRKSQKINFYSENGE